MSYQTLFFAMLFFNGVLTGSLIKEWRKPPCVVVVDAAKPKPAGSAAVETGAK